MGGYGDRRGLGGNVPAISGGADSRAAQNGGDRPIPVPAGPPTRSKITPKVREYVIQRDGLSCRYCGFGPMKVRWHYNRKGRVLLYNDWDRLGDITIELDHLIPVSRGGKTTPENLVVLCRTCNATKWNRPLCGPLRAPSPFRLPPRPTAAELGWKPAMADRRFW